jgi:hypothetical protein
LIFASPQYPRELPEGLVVVVLPPLVLTLVKVG